MDVSNIQFKCSMNRINRALLRCILIHDGLSLLNNMNLVYINIIIIVVVALLLIGVVVFSELWKREREREFSRREQFFELRFMLRTPRNSAMDDPLSAWVLPALN